MEQKESYGHYLRSKAYFIEHDQRNNKAFFNIEKQNYNEKLLKKLKLNDGTETFDANEILEETAKFYENLYKRNSLVTNFHDDYFLTPKYLN